MAEKKRRSHDDILKRIRDEVIKGLPGVPKKTRVEAMIYAGNLYDEKKVRIDKKTGKEINVHKYNANTVIKMTIKKYAPTSTADKLVKYLDELE